MRRLSLLVLTFLLAACTSSAPATFPVTFGLYGGVAGHSETLVIQDTGQVDVRTARTTSTCALTADARQQLTTALQGTRWTNRSPQVPAGTSDYLQHIVKDSAGRYLSDDPENQNLRTFQAALLTDVTGEDPPHRLCT